MPKSKRNYSQNALDDALNRVKLGELSQRQAAAQYGIPRSTIFDKLSGRRPPDRCPMGPSPYLSVAEEARIASWAIQMSRIGYERNKSQILQMAQQLIREDGRSTPFKDGKPGRNWFERFLKRNPQLSIRKPQALGQERAVMTPEKVDRWFAGLEGYLKEEGLTSVLSAPDRIWNADKREFALSPCGERVLGMRGSRFGYSFSTSKKLSVTTLEAGCASGMLCPPFIVYSGKRIPRKWKPLEGAPGSWFCGISELGLMNTGLFYGWLVNHFHPFLLSQEIPFPVLLLVDWDTNHVNLPVAEFCKENKIILYNLLEHASHVIQPLDLSFFGPLKEYYQLEELAWKDKHPGLFVTKAEFAVVFARAWTHMRGQHVSSGFRAAGIFPFTKEYNRDKLAPSQVFVNPPVHEEAPSACCCTCTCVKCRGAPSTSSTGSSSLTATTTSSAIQDFSNGMSTSGL